ncbi:MAG: 4-hydroxy-3-methylbut-2-enyl diphosphate reductase [Candidatus Omnitrophica bacterium]|nr:4-hydroxy-3-methylbut-2-enyl diphosphate reductase [Candidatus Omnitrophota bacterium]MDD5417146.1 4-hydroxy-3-methylbut-2-enyl diphosphate reductase [Candidatus Aenigmarchaeota archaeon]
MKINVAKSAGFCFGVKRAVRIALETAGSGGKIYMLGDIVHNEDVVSQIEGKGIQKIKKTGAGTGKRILLIRAHGERLNTVKKARRLGYTIVDATCPMVKEIHTIAREMEKKGYTVIIIGDAYHDEVRGIKGQLKTKSVVIGPRGRIPVHALSRIKKACVVVQSTQNREKVSAILRAIKKQVKNLRFFNTICRPTKAKQEEIKTMPVKNDVMIIIGSKASANTRRLFEISKTLNKRSYWIQSKSELKPDYFRRAKSAGITAGASTPERTTREVIEHIKKLTRKKGGPKKGDGSIFSQKK